MSNGKIDVGFIGLGKLGLPVCITIASEGYHVTGYDIDRSKLKLNVPTEERGETNDESIEDMIERLDKNNITFTDSLETVLDNDIIFVAIHNPHDKLYEGITRLSENRADFNYEYLKKCIKSVSEVCDSIKENKIIVIISTVLPGTIRREIIPIMSKYIKLCYNPHFIAMGTVVQDYLEPEFVLLGYHDNDAMNKVSEFYNNLYDNKIPIFKTSIENSEMIKVSYNTFIGAKICIANTIMEMCDKLPNTNCSEVMEALYLSNKRLISKSYLEGGMGDGGGCHPRDNIALSWLANKLDVSFNFYDSIMIGREKQTDFLANLIESKMKEYPELPLILLGKSFKSNTNLIDGSPAVLLKNILEEKEIKIYKHYDPFINLNDDLEMTEAIYFLATKHDVFKTYKFVEGSVVIDPFRYIDNIDGVKIYQVGKSC